jgi:hypothetical protein
VWRYYTFLQPVIGIYYLNIIIFRKCVDRTFNIHTFLTETLRPSAVVTLVSLDNFRLRHFSSINTIPNRRLCVQKDFPKLNCYCPSVVSFHLESLQTRSRTRLHSSFPFFVPYKVHSPKHSWFPCYKGLNHCCLPPGSCRAV